MKIEILKDGVSKEIEINKEDTREDIKNKVISSIKDLPINPELEELKKKFFVARKEYVKQYGKDPIVRDEFKKTDFYILGNKIFKILGEGQFFQDPEDDTIFVTIKTNRLSIVSSIPKEKFDNLPAFKLQAILHGCKF